MRRKFRGQSLVEFAFVLPILLMILMILFDFGRAVLAYNTVSEAARNGARVSIVNQIPADICSVAASRAIAIAIPTTCAATPAAIGIFVTSSCAQINCVETVKATYRFNPITPIIGNIIGGITMSSTSQVKIESVCASGTCPTT
jgi:Flp pilus assembly protein TadG